MNKKAIARAVKAALFASTTAGLAISSPTWAAEDNDAATEDEKVVITGTRIRTDEINDTIPVEVIMADDAIDRGFTTVGQLLRQSTLASGSSQVTAATSTEFVQDGGVGAETLSLRGLGANRTLVLLNGRRAGPAGTRGSVSAFDFNSIPLSAVERIDILKDGASSLYGSDAIAGVVNIITKTGDGGTVDVFASLPEESGGERSRLSFTWGKTFERASFRITADYDKQTELARGDRSFLACGEAYQFNADGSRADVIDPRTGRPLCSDLAWGHVWLYDYGADNADIGTYNLAQYDYDGDLGNYINGPTPANDPNDITMPAGWFLVNGATPVINADHPFQDLESLIPESTRATVMAVGEVEITDDMRIYSELLLNQRKTNTQGYRQFWGYIYNENFFGGNPLSAGWTGAQWLSPTAITDHSFERNEVNYSRFVAGIDGEIGEWFFDASVQYSRSDADYTNAVIYDDAISDQNWLTGSCAGMTTSVRGVACQDIPWLDPQFLAGNISPDMRAFLFGVDTGNTTYEQTTVEANLTGDLFEMGGGYAAAAFGLQYQRDQINDTPSQTVRDGNAWGSSMAGITEGAIENYAVFGEIQLPIMADKPGIERLDLTLSARYNESPEISNDTTYKAGLAWGIGGGVTVRGSVGTSFRAPALFELFLADETGFVRNSTTDPCTRWQQNLAEGRITQTIADNCAADGVDPNHFASISAGTLRRGGLGKLEAETATSSTWGIVWRPEFANLSFSVDYFDYEIENEVTTLGARNIVWGCYSSEFFPNEPLCDLFERRSADNGVDNIVNDFINIAKQTNKGVDVRLDYEAELPLGVFKFSTEHTFQREAEQELFPGNVIELNGGLGEPKHTANLNLRYEYDNWYVNWFVNYIGPADNFNNGTVDAFANTIRTTDIDGTSLVPFSTRDITIYRKTAVGSVSYHTLSFGQDNVIDGLSYTFGIRNLLNEEPPKISAGAGNRIGTAAFYSQYDFIGRSAFFNVKYEF